MNFAKKIVLIFILFSISCSPFEIARIAGIGTKPFKTQGKVYSKTFNKDFFTCYDEMHNRLKELGVNFYRGGRKQGFIIATNFNGIFKQCSDSTEVAVFFEEIGPVKTKVEISSLNHYLSQFVASKLFDQPKKNQKN